MSWVLHHHDARRVSELLAPESVDLIVTSPPYFALRSYRDGGEHYDGQVGSEASPSEFVDALIECTADWLKVLKPTGSLFVNLGDKYAGSGGHNNSNIGAPQERGPLAYNKNAQVQAVRRGIGDKALREDDGLRRLTPSEAGVPAKSKMALPWRYAIRCIDELGLILRADIIWSKPNGLPESVTDRVRGSHEYLFHFTRQGRYYAAIDEVREPHNDVNRPDGWKGRDGVSLRPGSMSSTSGANHRELAFGERFLNPLGKVPGSVWSIPSEPLQVPDHLGVDHFAAFPSELPRRCILGWTPTGWCTECGEPRRAVVEKECDRPPGDWNPDRTIANRPVGLARPTLTATITGYACACPTTNAPTTPAVVLDPFAGTGTTPAVASLLGRHGIGTDLSRDYLRLAEWRCRYDVALRSKVRDRSGIPNPQPPKIVGQLDLFGEEAS